MDKLKSRIKHLPLRWKLTAMVLVLLTVTLLTVTLFVTHYSTKSYTELQKRYNEAAMQEVSYELETILSNVDLIYRTFSTQNVFNDKYLEGGSAFERVSKQMSLENMVSRVLHANQLSEVVEGVFFYLNDRCSYYVGEGAPNRDLDIEGTDWYREFVEGGGQTLVYGPLREDIKSPLTVRHDCIYFLGPYGQPAPWSDSTPFLLFTLRLDALLSTIRDSTLRERPMMVLTEAGELLYASGLPHKAAEDLTPRFLNHTEADSRTCSYFENDYYICGYHQPGFDWWMVFLDDGQAFFEDLNSMNHRVAMIISLIALVSVLVVYLLIKKVTMPLTTLDAFIDIMQHDPDAYIDVDPGTEAGRIGARLNEMKQKLGTMTQQMYQLQLQERDAQVSALQSQINPHFIYNTLDNIYCIAQLGETEPIILLSEHLSKMMRYSLSMKRNIVPLSDELQHLESYVAILNVRFGDKIRILDQIPEELRSHPVLKLSLQPLAENAWYHSLISCPEGGDLILSAGVRDGMLELTVENTGAPVSQETCDELNRSLSTVRYSEANVKASHGIALENISNRLKLTFGEAYSLQLSPRKEGGCRVTMTMPYAPSQET